MASPRKARADRAPCVHAYLAKEWQIEWVVYGYARMHQWKFSIECSHMGRTAILIHGASQISPASPMSISVLGVCEHLPRLHNHGSMWNILTRIRQSWEMPVESRVNDFGVPKSLNQSYYPYQNMTTTTPDNQGHKPRGEVDQNPPKQLHATHKASACAERGGHV